MEDGDWQILDVCSGILEDGVWKIKAEPEGSIGDGVWQIKVVQGGNIADRDWQITEVCGGIMEDENWQINYEPEGNIGDREWQIAEVCGGILEDGVWKIKAEPEGFMEVKDWQIKAEPEEFMEVEDWQIKAEPEEMSQSPEDKKPDFSNFPRGAIGIKGLPVGRNARLPSIRSPRDLTLGSQPKRTFTPNIPVRREKKSTDAQIGGESSTGGSSNLNTSKSTPQRSDRGRGRGRGKGQIIQLEGSTFGEGIAPSLPKASSSRHRESLSKSEFSSGRPYVKKERPDYDMKHMEQEMKNLLRDDFIDDGADSSGDESQKPVIFPMKEIKEKQEKIETDEKPEKFPSQDFAKTMGYDVEKIAKFIKKEKKDDPVVQPDWSKVPKNEISELLTSRDSPLFLLQAPQVITTQSNAPQNADSSEEKKNVTTLASMPDGSIGKLQILKSGRTRINIGSLNFYIDDIINEESLRGKRQLVLVDIDSGVGDLACLGFCEKTLILEPDIDSLMPEVKNRKF